MIAIVWEFIVRPESIERFRKAYGPSGDWAALFTQQGGYKGTVLLQDTTREERFLTIEQWGGEEQFNEMLAEKGEEYCGLDQIFEELTVSEEKVGVFHH
jgi:hypothetical protein